MQSIKKLKFCKFCGGPLVWSEDDLYDDPNDRYDGLTGKSRSKRYAIGECPEREKDPKCTSSPGMGQPWHTYVEYPLE